MTIAPANRAPNAIWIAGLPIASAVISRLSVFLVIIVAARIMPPAQFGLFAILGVIGGIVTALVSGGGDMWLNRFTAGAPLALQPASSLWRGYLAICAAIATAVLVTAAVIVIVAPLPATVHPAVMLMFVGSVAAGLAEAGFAVLRARGHVTAFFAVRDLSLPVIFLLGVVAIQPGSAAGLFTIHAGLWTAVAAVLLTAIWWTSHVPATGPTATLPGRRLLIDHTVSLQAGNLSHRVAAQLDILVLTWIVALGTVGDYRVAAQFAVGFAVVQHFVFLGLPWQMRQNAGPTFIKGLAEVRRRQHWLIALSAVALVLGWLLAEPFLAFIAPRFADSAWLFRLLMLIRFAELLWGPQHEVLVSNGLARRDATANVVAIVVWAALFGVLITFSSALGAAVGATALAAAAGQAARHRSIRRACLTPVTGPASGIILPLLISVAVLIAATSIL